MFRRYNLVAFNKHGILVESIRDATKQQILDLNRLRIILGEDVQRCLNELQQPELLPEDEQFWGRTLVRNVFAFIEAIIYAMKQTALAAHIFAKNNEIFSPAFLI